jgi:hypothetical protein
LDEGPREKLCNQSVQGSETHALKLRGEVNRHTGYDEDCNTGINPDERLVIDGLAR